MLKKEFYIVLFIVCAAWVQIQANSEFKSLPSPLYGGDSYYQHGVIQHIREGGASLESSSFLNGRVAYLPVYSLSCAFFCDIFKVDTQTGMFYFSVLALCLGIVVWCCLGFFLYKDRYIALMLPALAICLGTFPILKYTDFAYFVVLPLLLLALAYYENKKSVRSSVLLGFVVGICALTHGVLFLSAVLICHIFFLLEFFKQPRCVKVILCNYVVFLITMLPLALVYWWEPIFVFHLNSTNKFLQWNVKGYFENFKQGMDVLCSVFKPWFNLKKPTLKVILNLFCFMNVFVLFFKKSHVEWRFVKKILLCSVFLGVFFLVTVPLFMFYLPPDYCMMFWQSSFIVLFIAQFVNKCIRPVLLRKIVVCLMLIMSFYVLFEVLLMERRASIWTKIGFFEISDLDKALQQYILNNTEINDVILSTKYMSFAVNALTGRKLLTNRWAHQGDPMMDYGQRDLDAAVILFGKDDVERERLIRKYKVKYLYWNSDWNNFIFDPKRKGKSLKVIDPFMDFYSIEGELFLKKNGVDFVRRDFYVDPSCRGPLYVKHDLLIVLPFIEEGKNIRWSYKLDKYLTNVFEVKNDATNEVSCLYSLNVK